jgi:cytochrome c-type biogenesis protein CcmH/NrfG
MNNHHKNYRNKLPQWQSDRMRTLIEERWSEVWEIVMAREHSAQDLQQHSRSSRRNSDF